MKHKCKIMIISVAIIFVISCSLLLIKGLFKKKKIDINDYTQVYLFDLGESNVEIIKKNDFVILVNTGLSEDLDDLIDELNKLEIYEIDYLIITNKDDKYVGNVTYLIDNYLVDYIYMNDYEYSSILMDKINDNLIGAYTEKIVLTSSEVIMLDDLVINIYPYMENDFSMEDKTLVVEMKEGENSIYLMSNSSNNRLKHIDNSTLLVSENDNIFKVNSKYYVLDGKKNKNSLKRDLKVYFNKKEFIIN